MQILFFVILSLSTWRLTHMLCHERGPFAVLEKIRAYPLFSNVLACYWCASFWVGLLHALLYAHVAETEGLVLLFPTALAFSTIAIAINGLSFISGRQ